MGSGRGDGDVLALEAGSDVGVLGLLAVKESEMRCFEKDFGQKTRRLTHSVR